MKVESQIMQWFDHFHKYPEISWKEYETTNKIAEILDGLEVPYRRFDDVTGLLAEIGQGDEVIAVRADIDALWQEVDGEFRANHSCGHDANISMVLGALILLKDEKLNKRIRFIFQPAEEKGNGSNAMIDRGALEDVTHLFGVHLRPIEELPFGKISPAIHHGAAMFLEGKITGIDAHGARPYQGKNAIDVTVAIHQALKNLYFSPFEAYSAKLTKIQAGGENANIIPGAATFSIDARAQKNAVLFQMKEQIEKDLHAIKLLFDIEMEWKWEDITPGAEVSKEAAAIAREGIIEVVGMENLAEEVITSGSDDFHFYTIRYPEVKAAMIGIGADLAPGLHHPNMTFNYDALAIGAKVIAKTLSNSSKND
ncbi:amidohydrolase [Psychrobacillus sp. OK032]|uniref:amidohydrolase n=1 Tax=Psychrobacillus sp. OK032 TaxID=1884358 RepID=UPI0008AA9854|nr:amidohydrolase [Psychrobacillus sp. OK032]SES23294.1 amidohydrolase [Psychrobacillus sp. OK032]